MRPTNRISAAILMFIAAHFIFSSSGFANGEENDYVTWEGKYRTKYVFIQGLEEDLFQKYYIKNSRGPSWGHDGDTLSDWVGADFYERSTYWAESGYPTESCPKFTDEDFENALEYDYGLTWEAVKRIKGSKKTVFYLGNYYISIGTGKKSCTFNPSNEKYVFLNKLTDGVPQFLGYLSDRLPKPDDRL